MIGASVIAMIWYGSMMPPTLHVRFGRAVTAAVLALALSMTLSRVAAAQMLTVLSFDRGEVSFGDAQPKVLGTTELAGIRAWLDAHRRGWYLNLVTPPVAEVAVSLGTSTPAPPFTLELWPTSSDPDWRSSIILEDVAGRSTWIQALSPVDAAVLLGLIR